MLNTSAYGSFWLSATKTFIMSCLLLCVWRGVNSDLSKTCEYNGHQYSPGVVDIEPCVSCICNGDSGQFLCSYKECPVQDDPSCTVYGTPTGQCCPWCMEHGCFHEGKRYPLGARIATGPCLYCYCPWKGDGSGKTVCSRLTCSDVTSCTDTVTPPGKCCPICPRGNETSSMYFGDPQNGYDALDYSYANTD